MKPRGICSLLLWFSFAFQGWADGAVHFQNHPIVFPDSIDRRVYFDFVGGNGILGTNFVAELWYGANADNISSIDPIVAPFFPGGDSRAGIWNGGSRALIGFGPGQTVMIQVKVWDRSLFSTYNEASSLRGAMFGASAPFSYTVPPFGALEGYQIENFRAFALVPEPSGLFLSSLLLTLVLMLTKQLRVVLVYEFPDDE